MIPLRLVSVGTIFGIAVCCGGGPQVQAPAQPPAHPDGTELVATISLAKDVLPGHALDATAAAALPHWELTWKDGHIVHAEEVRPGGHVASTVEVESTADGGTIYRTKNAYGAPVRTITFAGDRQRVVERSGISTYRGCTELGLSFDDAGNPTMETCYDPGGRIVIDESGCQVVKTSWSADHQMMDRACFDDTGRAITDAAGIHKTTFVYDTSGRETDRHFLGPDGAKVARAADGCFGWRTEYGTDGLAARELCLNGGGLPTAVKGSSHAGWESAWDTNACLKSRRYITLAGGPSTAAGIAEDRFENDANCGVLVAEHISSSGRLAQPGIWETAREKHDLNAEGLIVRQQCWGDGGVDAACRFLDRGRNVGSVIEQTFDNQGRATTWSAFTVSDQPADLARGNYPHQEIYAYDENGRLARETWQDAQGRPAKGLRVWAFAMAYDALGGEVSMRCLDEVGGLMNSPVIRCAEIRTTYDDQHRRSLMECLDQNGAPTRSDLIRDGVSWGGAASVRFERDGQHTVIANVFLSPRGGVVRRVDCSSLETDCYR